MSAAVGHGSQARRLREAIDEVAHAVALARAVNDGGHVATPDVSGGKVDGHTGLAAGDLDQLGGGKPFARTTPLRLVMLELAGLSRRLARNRAGAQSS